MTGAWNRLQEDARKYSKQAVERLADIAIAALGMLLIVTLVPAVVGILFQLALVTMLIALIKAL